MAPGAILRVFCLCQRHAKSLAGVMVQKAVRCSLNCVILTRPSMLLPNPSPACRSLSVTDRRHPDADRRQARGVWAQENEDRRERGPDRRRAYALALAITELARTEAESAEVESAWQVADAAWHRALAEYEVAEADWSEARAARSKSRAALAKAQAKLKALQGG